MKRRLLSLAVLAAVMGLSTADAYGFGKKKKDDCGAPCGITAGYATGYGAPCATTVTYVDQKVTVNELVKAKEEYKYWERVAETKKEKVTVKEVKTKEESYKYSVNELVTVKEKVKVADHKAVVKEVDVVTYDWKPTVTKQKRTVCEWVTVPVTVTCTIPAPVYAPAGEEKKGLFGRLCGKKKHNDCAPPCPTACETPCPQVVTRTVLQRQAITKEVEVDVTTYVKIEKKDKVKVTTHELVWVEKEVAVQKYVPAEKEGKRTVQYWVDVQKEIDVTTYKPVEKTGTREVWKCVPVEKVVKVAVHTPIAAPAPCDSPCAPVATPCTTTTSGGGLFKKHCCK
jgi:hypothetical protein